MHGLFSRGADLNVSHFESRRTQVVEGHVDPFPITVCKIAFHDTHEFLGRLVPIRCGKWVGKGYEIAGSVHLVCSLNLQYHQNEVPGSFERDLSWAYRCCCHRQCTNRAITNTWV